MCLAEYATVVERHGPGRALVRFSDTRTAQVSLAVLVAEGVEVPIGSTVMVSVGMALAVADAGSGDRP